MKRIVVVLCTSDNNDKFVLGFWRLTPWAEAAGFILSLPEGRFDSGLPISSDADGISGEHRKSGVYAFSAPGNPLLIQEGIAAPTKHSCLSHIKKPQTPWPHYLTAELSRGGVLAICGISADEYGINEGPCVDDQSKRLSALLFHLWNASSVTALPCHLPQREGLAPAAHIWARGALRKHIGEHCRR